MTFEQDAKTLELPWPFTGREDELELVRRSLTAGRPGIVVTGPAGCGKTRLATEAVRGTGCVRVTGTPETRRIPFAAFAHLLPETVSLHRAVRFVSGTGTKLLLVDDAHLLDDTSAALVHQLAVHGRVRLLVVVADGSPVPGAVSRLWTGELLPRLPLEPLSREETAQLVAAGAGGTPEPLTAGRLHRLCRGDLRLLRDLVAAVRDRGLSTMVRDRDLPIAVRDRDLLTAVRDRDLPIAVRDRDLPIAVRESGPPAAAVRDRAPATRLPHTGADAGAHTGAAAGAHTGADAGAGTRADTGAESGEWAWRGPVPVTAAVRERAAAALDHPDPAARETLERLAFAEPLPLRLDDDALDLDVLEHLEADALIRIDDHGAVRLAHPLHGPALRAAAGRLRARRLARTPEQCAAALAAEAATLLRHIEEADVRSLPAPVGEWLAEEGAPVPAGYAAVRARFSRLRGALREAAAWAREGLRTVPGDVSCRLELALSTAQSGDVTTAHAVFPDGGAPARAATWLAAARADVTEALAAVDDTDPYALYDAVRLGAAEQITGLPLPAGDLFARHAEALAHGDGPGLDRVARGLEERGFLLFAAEAHAQAVRAHRDPRAARTSRTRAVALARRCQGPRTPALSGLALGELTARQRQIVTLAAAGLSNRQIAEHLTLSVRTVGNHLYSAYIRLGAADRGALPWLVDLPGTDAEGEAEAAVEAESA